MAGALTVHASKIEEWPDEQDLAISAPKSTIILFNPHSAQFNTHPQVILNNSLLLLEKTLRILGVTFDAHFKFNVHIKSIVIRDSPKDSSTRPLLVSTGVSKRKHFHLCRFHLVSKRFTITNPENPNYSKLCPTHK